MSRRRKSPVDQTPKAVQLRAELLTECESQVRHDVNGKSRLSGDLLERFIQKQANDLYSQILSDTQEIRSSRRQS